MEFLKNNYLDTTTQLSISSGTATAEYLFTWDRRQQYTTDGFNNDNTTASIRINFDETLTVSRLALLEHNLKEFTIFYNGTTANTFAITGGHTTASAFTGNTDGDLLLSVTPVACTSVTIDMKKTMTANQDKAVGYFLTSDTHMTFPQIPSAKNYKPNIDAKEVVHKLSDGGTRVHKIADRYVVSVKLEYIDSDFRSDLKAVYDINGSVIFNPFGTSTGWDGFIMEAVWEGDFGFYQFSDNAENAGFSGTVNLKEIPY